MAEYGVTLQGFVAKRQPENQSELEASLRAVFGKHINLLPTETLGQIVGIISEREALLWELAAAVYDSQFPETASGINLDYVVSITGIERLQATPTEVDVYCTGIEGTIIPQDTIFSIDGNPDVRFETDQQTIIEAGTDEVQTITFSDEPDDGSFTLVFNGEETAPIAWDDVAADVEAALNALVSLSGVTVTGDYATGFVITFSGGDGEQPIDLLVEGTNTLEETGNPITISVVETIEGEYPNVTVPCTCQTAGAIPVYAETLTVIETPVMGLNAVINPLDGTIGRNIETDAELRIRRLNSLAFPGASTPDAIRAKVLQVEDVRAAIVFTNVEMVTDPITGLPPKSFHVVVEGGDEQDLADTIWNVAPAGIYSHGVIEKSVYDSQGIEHKIRFSRPTPIEIYMEVDIWVDPVLFPVDGDDAVKQSIVDFAIPRFSIADDVITTELYCPIHKIQGITDVEIRIGTAPVPITDDNIPMAIDEVSDWDTTRIIVNIMP